jgi:hypothetical protein
MKRWVRALPIVLLGALAAMGPATVARAAASDRSHSSDSDLQLTAVGGATGAGIAIDVDPGASVKRLFVVANRSNSLRVTVRLAGVDATARSGGDVTYASSASPNGPGSWLTLSDVVTTLEPGANVRVALTVTPPDNATPGEVTAGLVARVDHAARASDNGAVDAPGEVALPVTIKVNGAPTALVSIASVRPVKADGREYVDITFQNSGATPATMSGQVRVSGSRVQSDPVRVTIPPLTHTNVRVPFTMPDGEKTVPVSVTTQDASGNEATWGGNVGFTLASSAAPAPKTSSTPRHAASTAGSNGASFPPPVLVLVGLVFLAAAVWFGLEMRRNRAGRRAKRVRVPVAAAAPGFAHASADGSQMGAVAAQLGELVEAIDRLVARLGDGTVPVAGAPASSAPPAQPESPAPKFTPPTEPVPANPAPMFYAPAANRGPGDEFDPYDWPSQEQLDQFAARRRAAQSDM